jgi:hypothetical protein
MQSGGNEDFERRVGLAAGFPAILSRARRFPPWVGRPWSTFSVACPYWLLRCMTFIFNFFDNIFIFD